MTATVIDLGLPSTWIATQNVRADGDGSDAYYCAEGPNGREVWALDPDMLIKRVVHVQGKQRPHVIFLDVDEVLADWIGGLLSLLSLSPDDLSSRWAKQQPRQWDVTHALGTTPAKMWPVIDAAGASFWSELAPFPWAHDLVALCTSLAPTVLLTSASKHPSCYAGKAAWLAQHFPDVPHLIARGCKSHCAHERALLIDDSPHNIAAFAARGGDTILFPGSGNDLHALASTPMPRVRDHLRGLFG